MRATDALGNGWGGSNMSTRTCDAVPPSAPALGGSSSGPNTLDLTWGPTPDAGSGTASFRIHYDNDVSGAPYAGTDAAQGASPRSSTVLNYTLSGFTDCRTYFAAVTAVDVVGNESTFSNEVVFRSECGGDATFASGASYPTGANPAAIATADFNGDGIADVAVATADDNTVSILLGAGSNGRGNGVFLAPSSIVMAASPRDIAAGDFTGDGIVDLAVTHFAGGSITPLIGTGSGGFVVTPMPLAVTEPAGVILQDFNEDGLVDIATACTCGLGVFLGLPGGFSVPVVCPLGTGSNAQALVAGDFNADSILDVVVTKLNTGSGQLSIHLGQGVNGRGNGAFNAGMTHSLPGSSPRTVSAGDFNYDGILDLAVVDDAAGGVLVLFGDFVAGQPTGTFLAPVPYTSVGADTRSALVTDVNEDGILDLVLANFGLNNFFVLRGNGLNGQGNGTFAAAVAYASAPTRCLAQGDFDENGIVDLLLCDNTLGPSGMRVHLGGGTGAAPAGTFASPVFYSAGSDVRGVVAADFDADRILDLVVANFASNTVSILRGQGAGGKGTGTVAQAQNFAAGAGPDGIAAGDFNADRILDVVVAHNTNGADVVSVYLGNGGMGRGNGTFAPRVNYALGFGAKSAVTVADFNDDGILDIGAVERETNGVRVMLGSGAGGRGDGTFVAGGFYEAGGDPRAIVLGDFNADAIVDLAVANFTGNNVSVFLGNGTSGQGDGTFALDVLYAAGSNPEGIAVGDFNADYVLDLAVSNRTSANVSILLGAGFEGKGNGTFALNANYPSLANAGPLVARDLNGDNILDLVVADISGASLAVLFGGGSGGKGDGVFGGPVSYAGAMRGICIDDFDEDGILDIAGTKTTASANVSISFGQGTFQ